MSINRNRKTQLLQSTWPIFIPLQLQVKTAAVTTPKTDFNGGQFAVHSSNPGDMPIHLGWSTGSGYPMVSYLAIRCGNTTLV